MLPPWIYIQLLSHQDPSTWLALVVRTLISLHLQHRIQRWWITLPATLIPMPKFVIFLGCNEWPHDKYLQQKLFYFFLRLHLGWICC
jgi:hypothetical protein